MDCLGYSHVSLLSDKSTLKCRTASINCNFIFMNRIMNFFPWKKKVEGAILQKENVDATTKLKELKNH
jgi:hypothetical protein